MLKGSHQETWRQGEVVFNKHPPLNVIDVDIYPVQNEKLTVERAFSEDSMSKIRKVNAELRVGKEFCFSHLWVEVRVKS